MCVYIYIRTAVKYAFMSIKGKLGWRAALPSRRKLEGSEENESFEMNKSGTLNCSSFFLLLYLTSFILFKDLIIELKFWKKFECETSDVFFFTRFISTFRENRNETRERENGVGI